MSVIEYQPGDKIVCVKDFRRSSFEIHYPEKGKIYTIKSLDIGRWPTAVYLEEDSAGYGWNSAFLQSQNR